jgi:hypothetical protein
MVKWSIRTFLFFVLITLFASPSYACEPIAVWVVIAGPAFLSLTLSGLVGAVLIKCVAFSLLDRELPFYQRPLFMFIGNILSSMVGLALALPFAAGGDSSVFVFAGVALVLLTIGPSRRLSILLGREGDSTFLITIPYIVCLFGTGALFGMADMALTENMIKTYWLLKLAYVGVAFAISFGITSTVEEWVISVLSRKGESPSFMNPVLKANLFAFLLVGAIGAMIMLPKRLHSPGFLASLIDLFSGLVT